MFSPGCTVAYTISSIAGSDLISSAFLGDRDSSNHALAYVTSVDAGNESYDGNYVQLIMDLSHTVLAHKGRPLPYGYVSMIGGGLPPVQA